MVSIADIQDSDSLRDWLEGQPKEVSAWIARRAAIRVLPIFWEWAVTSKTVSKDDFLALPFLRFFLISEVAGKIPTSVIITAFSADANDAAIGAAGANGATDAAFTSVDAASDAADAVDAASDAAVAGAANAADGAAGAAANAAEAIDRATPAAGAAAWKLIRADCTAITSGDDLDHLPLWGDQENLLAKTWAKVKQHLPTAHSDETARGADATDWSFWIKWYEDALAGTPPNWDMLERIALIDPKEWDKGAERVNPMIAEIQLRYELKEQISVLEAKLQSASTAMRGMGDNQGPPLGAAVAKELLIVWAPLQELKQEVDNEAPSKSRVLEIAGRLLTLSITIGKWAAGKVDMAVNAFAVAAGTAAVGFAVAWYTQEAGTVAGMLSKIAELAGKWAGYLP